MTETLTARQELYEIAEALRIADEQEKAAKEEKTKHRGPFMALISEIVRDEIPLAQKSIQVRDEQLKPFDWDYRSWGLQNYPDWVVVMVSPYEGGATVVIEENPDLKKFEFIHDGFKYGRTMDTGSPTFDAERFYKEKKNLQIDDYPLGSLIEVTTTTTYALKESKASALMAEHPEVKDILQEYITVPVPKPKLLPIRPIREEEE